MSDTPFTVVQKKPSIQSVVRPKSQLVKELIAEFVGTLLLVHIQTCVSAQYILSRQKASSPMVVTFGSGLAVFFAVTTTYSISGGQINPSVTLMNWCFGKLPFAHFVAYTIVQVAGAFCGAGMTFAIYNAAIEHFDGGVRSVIGVNSTAVVFVPFPSHHLGVISGVIDSVMCSIIFIVITAAVGDERNKLPTFLIPLWSGIIVMMMGSAFGMNSGSPVNPARDLGPRIFMLCAGYDWDVFSHNNWEWFWIPIICPLIGALIASFLYKLFTELVQSNLSAKCKDEGAEMMQIDEKL